eukprot:CAMPEP_0113305420 /NCGR_PEP_ID=MMETSP0010_2-20120614/5057_1 /TAXON_ID=216773 ORGANISM="Corethron hystrix, Strain 308" /NCGR_SAMPLE_ID=MMETSP0010_2 /ASSEMBLY_ACC=CAM_ASM_000155 /LENGTH=259 /DNA_ID=CAMNT_0000159841 /DNA_START=61 /DNA_END=840 /DNA_ORIENTATION=+ /assembly_acc=CAM_ASM_000155
MASSTAKARIDPIAKKIWQITKSNLKVETKESASRALKETGLALKYAGGQEIYATHRSIMLLYGTSKPYVPHDCFVAPSATVAGNVTCWDTSSVWYGAVVRGDRNSVKLGFKSSLGDRSVINTVTDLTTGLPAHCDIGHYVTVKPGAVLVSCTVDNHAIIGEGCVVLEGSLVESETILEPNTVVPANARIPSGQKWGGNPAAYIADLTEEEKALIVGTADEIALTAAEHLVEYLPYGNPYAHLEELEKEAAKLAGNASA